MVTPVRETKKAKMEKLIIWHDAAFILIDGELHYQMLDNHNQINVAFDDEYDWKASWKKFDVNSNDNIFKFNTVSIGEILGQLK